MDSQQIKANSGNIGTKKHLNFTNASGKKICDGHVSGDGFLIVVGLYISNYCLLRGARGFSLG